MLNKTTETLGILIPNGSAAGEYRFKKTMRSDFTECTGVCLYTTNNGGDANFQVEVVNDKGNPIFEMVHNRDVEGSINVAREARYKEVLFPTEGRQITVRILTKTALSADLVADLVFQTQTAK